MALGKHVQYGIVKAVDEHGISAYKGELAEVGASVRWWVIDR
jgi:hypothetical protein